MSQLKAQPGRDILIWGHGRLTDTLTAAELLDEHRLWLTPVVKGSGERLFRPQSAGALELIDSTTFGTGSIVLTYRDRRLD